MFPRVASVRSLVMTPSLHVTIAEQRAGDSSRCCCSWRSDILFPVSSRPLVSPGVRYVHGRLQSDGGLSGWRPESGRKGATNRRQHHQTVSRRGKTLCESMSAVCKPQRFKPQLCVCSGPSVYSSSWGLKISAPSTSRSSELRTRTAPMLTPR